MQELQITYPVKVYCAGLPPPLVLLLLLVLLLFVVVVASLC